MLTVLTVTDVSNILRCHRSTVYRNYKSLNGFKVGGLIRFTDEGLKNAILQQTAEYLDRASQIQGQMLPQNLSDKAPGKRMGGKKERGAEKTGASGLVDSHSLLA